MCIGKLIFADYGGKHYYYTSLIKQSFSAYRITRNFRGTKVHYFHGFWSTLENLQLQNSVH